jgi:hypothetical protein
MVAVAVCAISAGLPAAAQFETRSLMGTNPGPNSVVVADFNRDGKMDIAVSTFGCPTLSCEVQIFLGKGDGTFAPPTAYLVGIGNGPLAVADLNGDGNPDLVVANGCPNNVCLNSVSVLMGNGDGTFQTPVRYPTPSMVGGLILGDFDGDGKLDLATMNQIDSTGQCDCIGVLLGKGDGTFQEPAIVTDLGKYPEAIAAASFTSAKNLDLAVTESLISSDQVQILLGNGDGTFRIGNSYGLQHSSQSIVAADFRNNGIIDLAIGEYGGRGVVVLLGHGDGSFAQPALYPIDTPNGITAADMNGDGVLDIISGSDGFSWGSVGVFYGKGDGTFGIPLLYPAGERPMAVAVADFNGDRLPDMVVVGADGTSHEYIFMNTGSVTLSPNTVLHVPPSPAQTVTLTNNGTKDLTISSISITPHFHLHETCGNSVAPGANCSISVAFDTNTTPVKGTVKIVDSASTKPQEIGLTSTSVALSPSPMNFAPQKVGTSSAPMTLSVTNDGTVYLLFYQVSIVGSDLKDFLLSGGSNCTNAALFPGETCTVSVTFKPTKTGPRSAIIKFIDNGLGSPEVATLSGTGT